ncbi:MAG: PAS domain S-box protein [Mariprofundaceae bacterium]
MDSLFTSRTRATHLFLRILAAIMGAELAIMLALGTLGVAPGSVLGVWGDTLLLGLVASIAVYVWAVRPLAEADRRTRLFQMVAEHLDEGVVITEIDDSGKPRIVAVNPAFTRITGYDETEVLGRDPAFLNSPDSDAGTRAQLRRAIERGEEARVLQRNHRKDGTPFWNALFIKPLPDRSGHAALYVGFVRDVSERIERERELNRLRMALEQADEAVCLFDADGRVLFANKMFCVQCGLDCTRVGLLLHGKPPDEPCSGRCERVLAQDAWAFWRADETAMQAAKNALVQGKAWSGRHRMNRGDGREFEALSSVAPVRSGDADAEVCFVAVHRDVTELVQMERELRQAQKMEAVGTLVGGIAHDFNNVLAGILGNVFLVRKHLSDRPELARKLERVEEQGNQAAAMIRQLLGFARHRDEARAPVALSPFLRELFKFARVMVPENIEMRLLIEGPPAGVRGDMAQLQQSLLNLVTNAQHAIEMAGTDPARIEIGMRILPPEERDALIESLREHHPASDGHDWVELYVCDNGPGIPAEMLERVFEPFFTTKPDGVGTGLGLPMVRTNIEAMGGTVLIESLEGEGTKVRLLLPVLEECEEMAASLPAPTDIAEGEGLGVLVVDDHHILRETLGDVLEERGYRVLFAENGREALALWRKHASEIALVVTDVVMPEMGGVELLRCIRSERHVPAIVMTGYDKENHLAGLMSEPDIWLMRKPWSMSELARLLNEARAALSSS